MTARDEVLDALPRLRARLDRDDFTPGEVPSKNCSLAESVYKDSTIRTPVVSSMCGNAPENHAGVHIDIEGIGYGPIVSGRRDCAAESLSGVRFSRLPN